MGCCEDEAPAPKPGGKPLTLALAGNPNCGSSTSPGSTPWMPGPPTSG